MPSLDKLSVNLGVYVLIGVVILITTVLAPISGVFDTPEVQDQGETNVGTVTRVLEERVEQGPRGEQLFQRLEVRLGDETRVIENLQGSADPRSLHLEEGDRVLVTSTSGPEGDLSFIADYARNPALLVLLLAFAALVVAVARGQGVASLIAMAISLLVILRFIIPGIMSGNDPVLISIIGASIILSSTLFLSHGINRKTGTALLGTTVSLILTATVATLAIDFVRLTGLADDQSITLQIITEGGINAEGLLLSAIIIGALGVLDDVTVAQASAVAELDAANPALTARELFGRAMNIGRDHIASTVNTLFLAYAGAALPLLLILSLQTEPLGVLTNREFMATEIVRTLVGSIGIVASVPLTTAMAVAATRLGRRGETAERVV
ncbi:MAG: YibE/F family protein [Dehalococcoidia bacterium]|nr:YibE/F family protein [Dehalococcoidia bacterium]